MRRTEFRASMARLSMQRTELRASMARLSMRRTELRASIAQAHPLRQELPSLGRARRDAIAATHNCLRPLGPKVAWPEVISKTRYCPRGALAPREPPSHERGPRVQATCAAHTENAGPPPEIEVAQTYHVKFAPDMLVGLAYGALPGHSKRRPRNWAFCRLPTFYKYSQSCFDDVQNCFDECGHGSPCRVCAGKHHSPPPALGGARCGAALLPRGGKAGQLRTTVAENRAHPDRTPG